MKKRFRLILSFVMAVVLSLGLLACEEGNKNGVLSMDKVYSDITNSCKLTLDYTNKNFITDGIGLVSVRSVADGDTASFVLPDGTNFRVRFYGIDTPESTGEVEKWGKAASMFTTGILDNAYEVVLESSTGKAAVTDSYGERYLGYVWYRMSANEDFKNLNLQLVENGYTPNNCINNINYKYYSYFDSAKKFAEKGALRIWGVAHDEYFSDEAFAVTLKDLHDDIYSYFNEDLQIGSKVTFKATIIALKMGEGSDSTHLWTAAQIIDGKVYTFSIYTGYSSSPTSAYLKVGNEYQMTGVVQNHYGKFQISGLEYLLGETGDGYTYRTKANACVVFDSSISYVAKYLTNLKTDATITNAVVENSVLKLTVSAYTQTKKGHESTAETFEIQINVDANYDASQLLNKSMKGVVYLTEDGGSYYVPSLNDLSFE